MDPNVYDFTYDNTQPLTYPRNDVSYMPTGWKNEYPNFAQSQDVAERGMESSWVRPFVADLDVVLPTANPWTRPTLPYHYNMDIPYY